MKEYKPDIGSGDDGTTDLCGGARVSKTDPRVRMNALLDAVNASLGLAKGALPSQCTEEFNQLDIIQADIIKLSSRIAGAGVEDDYFRRKTELLEEMIRNISRELKLPTEFVRSGSNMPEALSNYVRAVVRMAEIYAWEIRDSVAAVYLNRLSDYMFLFSVAVGGQSE